MKTRFPFVCLALLGLAACQRSDTASVAVAPVALPAAPGQPHTQRIRASQMVGLDLAEQLAPIRDEVDLDIALQTLRERLAGKPAVLTAAELDTVRQEFGRHLRDTREQQRQQLAAKNQQASERFLAANAQRSGVVATASGLQYQVLRDSKGPRPGATDTVRVHYIGTRLDGSPFDNSYERDHPAEVVLNQVIAGWGEGLALMPVGSQYRFWLPGKLAYGDNGKPGELEPNALLIFDMELLEIAGQPLAAQDSPAAARE
ncbi:FKBP-type peptidyl-prolyl cis-trans isomerase FkpA/FKBP-type peptidyl-prolyl cis-trans isomerase FklB [Tahibacter aquaticus]|uniref:Peptidyl-prolyl cis-trans isomerase n=1 Tax=Tahibacter aquaticus TaxID=520092 RepID=A0A4R6YQ53_9GAMM|nr:FKBP-type peptidyl-prolyl cis-trans isomerase [Tahibacter aquaticus]TDR40031.1 FKBP-type peptidyl-prolyl cis-trans isomerase FkpA/FKBP-type peptidyl-prolyl cis-trans isomerase FklB [Tahibacter aquaticus]